MSDTFRGTVIEVKYGEADDEAARPLLEAMPFRWSRFSRYLPRSKPAEPDPQD